MKTFILLLVLAFSINYWGSGQSLTTIAAWDFFGQPSSATFTATVFNSNLSSSNIITRGAGASPSTGINSFRTTGFQNNGISTSNTDYFEVTLGATSGFTLSLSTIDARFNGTGSFYSSPGVTSQFAYSLDGSIFTLIGSPEPSTSLNMTQIDLVSIPDLQNVASGMIITLRYYASGQTTTGGWGLYSANAGSYGLAIGGSVNVAQSTQAATYSWNQTGTGDWTTFTNWTPARTTPQANDIIHVNIGGSCVITGVPAQTIGQLIISNNTAVNLQSSAESILAIEGETGTDLEVQAGSELNLNGANSIVLAVGTGATGSISGKMTFSSTVATSNSLTAVDPGSIIFNNGSVFLAGTYSSGNPFGTTSLESIIFKNGSTFIHQSGNDPFGASQPNSVVIFQPGSLYKVIANVPLSLSGRIYANFELDAPGVTLSPAGENQVVIDNLTVTNGTLNFNMTKTPGHSVKGNIYVATGSMLNFAPDMAGTVTLNGECHKSISGIGKIEGNTNSTIEIANSDGVSLNTQLTINGNLKLTNGLLNLGSNDLVLGAASAITGTPCASAMIVATSTGQVKKEFSAPGSFTYPIGDQTETAEYSPVTLTFNNGIFETGNYAGVNLVNAKYPIDLNTGNYLNRYWSISSNGITGFSCDALFQYVPADVKGIEGLISCVKVEPFPLISFGVTDTIHHELTASELTSFSTFTGSEAVTFVYEVAGSGSYCQGSSGLPVTLSGSQLNVSYQLKKNGENQDAPVAGSGSIIIWPNQLTGIYTVVGINGNGSTMMNGSAILEEMTSGAVGVSIVASANPVCPNTPVTFAATPVNGGSNPHYQWKVNGVNVGANSRTYAYTLVNNDAVACVMTSNSGCAQGSPAASNMVNMIVNAIMPVSVAIAASANPVSEGTNVTFVATPVNGGTNPAYQWKVNDANVGTNSPIFTYVPANNDNVVCIMTSNLQCVSCNPAISNLNIITVKNSPSGKSSFIVYPNPTKGTFTLEQKEGTEYKKLKIEVFGMNGERVMTAELTGEKKHIFSLSTAPPGLYLMRVFTGETIEIIRINKQ